MGLVVKRKEAAEFADGDKKWGGKLVRNCHTIIEPQIAKARDDR